VEVFHSANSPIDIQRILRFQVGEHPRIIRPQMLDARLSPLLYAKISPDNLHLPRASAQVPLIIPSLRLAGHRGGKLLGSRDLWKINELGDEVTPHPQVQHRQQQHE
jgi:hypothetical protein